MGNDFFPAACENDGSWNNPRAATTPKDIGASRNARGLRLLNQLPCGLIPDDRVCSGS